MSNVKPVDLAAMRRRAGILAGRNMHTTAREMRDAADEIETWRTLFAAHDKAANARPFGVAEADAAGDLYDRLRALLPPS